MLSFKYMDNQFIFIMYRVKSNKTFGFLILVCFIVGMAFIAPVSALTHITDATGLQNMNLNLTEDYVLDNDIDLSGITWTTIGNSMQAFTGSLNGNGSTIDNFSLTGTSYVGLFGQTSSATISNLSMNNPNVVATDAVIGYGSVLIGFAANTKIENCRIINGTLTGTYYVGMFMGNGQSVNITNCYATGNVSASGDIAGGLIGTPGWNSDSSTSELLYCYAKVNVSADINVGGLAGAELKGQPTITSCVYMGNAITGTPANRLLYVSSSTPIITDSYALSTCLVNGGTVTSSDPTSVDGADVTFDQLGNQTWWETSPQWSLAEDSVWYWNSEIGLPDLRSFVENVPHILNFPVTPSVDTILLTNTSYSFTANTKYADTFLWNFGDGTTAATASATHAYSASGSYNVSLTISNAWGSDTAYHIYTVFDYAEITNVTATLLSTEQITLNTYSSQRYNPVQQYGLSASVLDIKYVSSSDAYMVSGNTPYYINSKTSVITPVSNYVGTNAVLCAIDESGIVIYDTEKVISYYSYATGTRQIIKMVDGVTSITLGKAYSPEVNVITYTTTANTYYYRIDTGVTYSSTTSSIYNGIVGNPYNKMFLSWNNVNLSNVTISYLNAGVVEDSTHQLALTAGTTIQSIQSIDNTNNFIIRTTDKIFVVEVINGSFNLISTSAGGLPAFSEVRADQQLEYMGLNETSAYFVSDTGALLTYYAGIAQLNTLAISSESGIWSAFGGNDMRLTVLGRASPTTWNVSDIIYFSASINKVALSTGGYYLTVVSDGSLYLLSQAIPDSSDTILTTKYYLQVYLMENGQYLDNTRFTVGVGETAPTTYTTDASGSYVVEVVPSRTYTIAFSDGSKSTTYTANNFALQYLILSKSATVPSANGISYNVSLDYRTIHMSYLDTYSRNNLVNFTISNATSVLQTYESITNSVSYVYDATLISDNYIGVTMYVSNTASDYTLEKSYTFWLKTYADPTNQTGLILPGAKKPLIPAAFWSDTGLPVKLDSELIQLIICGVLMVIAGLFGAQHSAKGALLVAGIAAIFTVLGLLVIDPIWVAMMVVIGILTLFSYARDYD